MYEDGAKVVYRYDNSGALAQVEDYATGILTKYMYDLSDRLMMYEEEAGEQNHRVRYYYDSMNNLTKVREGFDGVNRRDLYEFKNRSSDELRFFLSGDHLLSARLSDLLN